MSSKIVPYKPQEPARPGQPEAPSIVRAAGGNARFAYDEFFSGIDSPHTERAYRNAVHRFLAWCEARGLALNQVRPSDVADYVKTLAKQDGERASKPTRKLHLSALRHFFDKLVVRHAIALNPAASVRGPRHSVAEGKTPALTAEQARAVLAAIDTTDVVGLRDRAVIAVLIYTACRVGAVAKLRLRDFYPDGRQWCLRLDEKGGKSRELPVRHDLEGFIYEYVKAAALGGDHGDAALFRTCIRRTKRFAATAMTASDILRMVKRRLTAAGLPADRLTCHSFRATTITDLLDQGVPLEDVQYLAGHADPRTTRLYDRRKRTVTRNIVERISI